MVSKAEQIAGRSLHAILAALPVGASIADSEQFRDCLSALEFFVPEVLQEVHPEWKHESLDGIFPVLAEKTGEDEAEVFGQCILISDQTLTPIRLTIQVSVDAESIPWLELKLGESAACGMARIPYESPTARMKLAHKLSERGP